MAVWPARYVLPPTSNWVTVSVSFSTSLSLVRTLPVVGMSSITGTGPSSLATGASFSGVTVISSVELLPVLVV
ncbi:hypothetical protein E8E95_00065 [Pseudomonas sp. BN414]|nr:hypothetical protein [Pseudomonas sp. BN414]